jgi:hypothetical protein
MSCVCSGSTEAAAQTRHVSVVDCLPAALAPGGSNLPGKHNPQSCRSCQHQLSPVPLPPPPAPHLRCLVRQQRVLRGLLAVGARLELGEVAVVVALHLEVEHLALARGGGGDEVLIQQLQDAGADLAQLLLHLELSARARVCRTAADGGGHACKQKCGSAHKALHWLGVVVCC